MSECNVCGGCEFNRGTRHSSMDQCHMSYDFGTGQKTFAKKTQKYVSSDAEACKHYEAYLDWSKFKVIATQGHIAETLSPSWHTETFLVIEYQGQKYKLRKSDFAEKDTITKTRPKRTFRLIRNPRTKGGNVPHDQPEAKSDSTPSVNFAKKEDGDKHTQQTLAQVASDEPTTFGSHACYSLMQYEKYMSEEQDIAFETSGYSERDAWAFDHSAYDTWIRISILALIQRNSDTKYPIPQETTSTGACNLFERDRPVYISKEVGNQ